MTDISRLITESAKPSFRPDAMRRLVTTLLREYRLELGKVLATELLEAIPPEMGRLILDPLQRLGNRMAFQIAFFSCPDRFLVSRRYHLVQRLTRLISFLELELKAKQAVAHLELVKVYNERVMAYLQLANALGTLSDVEPLGSALQAALVEAALIAGMSEIDLTGRLAHSVLHEADAAAWARLLERMETTIPLGMANPMEPEFSDTEKHRGFDLLWEAISTSGVGSLTRLIGSLHGKRAGRPLINADDPPFFLGALVRNEGFKRAVIRVPLALREVAHRN